MNGYDFKSVLLGLGVGIILTAFSGILTLSFFLN
jgi:hypothetical protein